MIEVSLPDVTTEITERDRICPGEGPDDAEIVVVTDLPGWSDLTSRRALSDHAGRVLWSNFILGGLPRTRVRVESVCEGEIPGQDWGYANPAVRDAWEIDCVRRLRRLSGAKVIVALGDLPLRLLTGRTSADKWHMSVLPSSLPDLPPVLSALHPERVFREPVSSVWLRLAAERAREVARVGFDAWRTQRNLRVVSTLDELREVAKTLRTVRNLALDIETGRGQITQIGFAWSPYEAVSIPVLPGDWDSPETFFQVWDEIGSVLVSPSAKILQNGIYDLTYLNRYGIRVTNFAHDTMLAQVLLNAELPKGLDTLAKLFTREPYWKDDAKDWGARQDRRALAEYNARDCAVTYEVAVAQRNELEKRGLSSLFETYVMPFASGPALEFSWRGLGVDETERVRLLREAEAKAEGLTAELNAEAKRVLGEDATVNPRSPVQVKNLLRALGFPRLPVKNGKETSDVGALAKLRQRRPDVPALSTLIDLSEVNKEISSYLRFEYDPDGRMRYTFNAGGTETGRGCLARGTLIDVVRDVGAHPDGLPIEHVKSGDLAYCYDSDRNLTLKRVVWAGQTGIKRVIKITWIGQSNKTRGELLLTPEHRVRKLSGEYVEARNLIPGDRILALGRSRTNGYARLHSRNKELREHRFIFTAITGSTPEHVHHKNGRPLDNRINNLEGLGKREHTALHSSNPPEHVRAERSVRMREARVSGKLRTFRGESHGRSKLTDADVVSIRSRAAAGEPRSAILRDYPIAKATLGKIIRGDLWAHVDVNHRVASVELTDLVTPVYDLEIEDEHNFIANELCVHNSCYKDPWNRGLNAQTIPGHLKTMFRAHPGSRLVEIDLKQADARVVAWDSGDPTLLEFYRTGRDIHRYVASRPEVFGKDEREITKDERQLGKKLGHASNYGVSPPTLADSCLKEMNLVISPGRAEEMLEGYHRAFPGIRQWQKRIREEILRTRELRSPTGYVRQFNGRLDDAAFREAYAYKPQNIVVYAINRLALHLHGRFPLVLQIHDSLLIETAAARLDDLLRTVQDQDAWNPTFDLLGGRLRIPIEVKVSEVGGTWGRMTEIFSG